MKIFLKYVFSLVALALAYSPAEAQTALTQTTLSTAVTLTSANRITVASISGITAGSTLLFIDREALFVEQVLTPNVLQVQRGASGTRASGHVSGAGVLFGPPNAFVSVDPLGSCTAGSGVFAFTPVVNVTNGLQWLCSINGRVSPGFGNTTVPPNSTTLVASAAGAITPSGPLFHINGTAAITGFTLPVGFDPKAGQILTVIADTVFTWTAAGNIALVSGTVVALTSYTFTYDPNTSKFYQSR